MNRIKLIRTVIVLVLVGAINVSFGTSTVKDKKEVKAIKGFVRDYDHNGSYDMAAFGIIAKDRMIHVDYVEVLALNGEWMGNVGYVTKVREKLNGAEWFTVDLRDISPTSDFLLRIHLSSECQEALMGNTCAIALDIGGDGGGGDGDPEETILILKYP